MKKVLIVIDMQNDFIDGSLGTKEAVAIVPNVISKIKSYDINDVYATMDTHFADYLETQEGKNLPVKHCIKGTEGWEINKDIKQLIKPENIVEKNTFGSTELPKLLESKYPGLDIEIEMIGLCTDICVVSNALYIKANMPEVKISLDSSCCAGVTPEKHDAALQTMSSNQIFIK